MALSSRAHELLQVFDQPGCPVCRLTADSVHHYIWGLVYEYVNKVPTHMAVRNARGFCSTHAYQALENINASALGIAILYEGLIRNMLNDMGAVEPNSGRRQLGQAAKALEPRGACPVCEHRDRVEDQLLRNLLDHIDHAEFAERFEQSAGLCLPHLRVALAQSGSPAAKARVAHLQQQIWRRLQRDLAEYVRKSDHHVDEDYTEDEGLSSRRAIEQISGIKGLR